MFERLVLALNYSGGLKTKSAMNLAVIGSEGANTAGEPFSAFLGFFNEAWREHDFRLGRANVHRELPKILGVPEYPREPNPRGSAAHNPHYDPEPTWPSFSGVGIKDADPTKREKFLDLAMDKIAVMLKGEPLRLGSIKLAMVQWFLKRKLRTLLGLNKNRTWYNPLTWI